MTEAREWTEELVAQYYEIQGYLVLRNIPTSTGKGGGRAEADVLAFKREGEVPVIRDVEVGTYYESAATIAKKLRKKFTQVRQGIVLDTVRSHMGLPANARLSYQPYYVDAAGLGEQAFAELQAETKPDGVLVSTLWDIIEDIPEKIEDWSKGRETEKGTKPLLPRSYDLLKVVEACYETWRE